jgi:hypothetical protein
VEFHGPHFEDALLVVRGSMEETACNDGPSEGDRPMKGTIHREADWQSPADDVVAGVKRKLAKEFPYRS